MLIGSGVEAAGVEAMQTGTSNVFCRVTKRRPCLICGKPDWRVYFRDESLSVRMRVADGARKINSHGGAIHLHIGERQPLFPIARALYPRAPYRGTDNSMGPMGFGISSTP
jgi:hypothetical protein